MKKLAWRKCLKIFLEATFLHSRSSRTKSVSLFHMISLAYKISHCFSANHNPELRCVICTGVTLSAPVLHFCTHHGQKWVFFLPLTFQRRLESSDENEIWHEYSLRSSTFNGSSLTSLTDIVTSQLTLIFDTKIWN